MQLIINKKQLKLCSMQPGFVIYWEGGIVTAIGLFTIDNYEDRISNSKNIINEKNNIISDLEIKIDELKNQNKKTKNKLEEYKIKIKDLLE